MFSTRLNGSVLRWLASLAGWSASKRFACFYLMMPVYGLDGHILDCTIRDCNEQAASLYGKTKAQVVGSSLSSYYHSSQLRSLLQVYELALRLGEYADEVQVPSSGGVYLEWVRRGFRRVGNCLRVTIEDVGAARSHEGELTRLAYNDRVTGLPNRCWMMEALPRMLAANRGGELLLALIDLHRFSDLNDELGMARGDAVLRWLADRLARTLPPGTAIARFGSDEFAAVVRLGHGDDNDGVIAALQDAMYGKPCPHAPALAAAIGISRHPSDAASAETLVVHAELALQAAKQSSNAAVVQYGPLLSTRLQLSRELEEALRPAGAGQVFLEYQPRFSVRNGDLLSMEALARWRHPSRGMVAPCEFIRLAEQRNLIIPLGQLIFDMACRQLSDWRAAGLPLAPVSVNVSAHQLQQRTLSEDLLACMAKYRIGPELIELEITESAMLGEQPSVIAQLRRLRALGFRLAMDDFGVGYSSLSQLKNIEMDVLKIDRTFTSDLSATGNGQVFFNAIVAMAHALGMRVVAEGVETAEQLAVLRSLRCDEAQGYLLSRPVPPQQIAGLLAAKGAPASVSSSGKFQIPGSRTAPSDRPGNRYSRPHRERTGRA